MMKNKPVGVMNIGGRASKMDSGLMRFSRRFRGLLTAVALGGLVVGCAQVPNDPEALVAYETANDPLEELNRTIFGVNLTLDRIVIRPIAASYRELPDIIRDGVQNFLRNLKTPIILANNILQGDQQGASDTIGRALINTIGGLGFFDVANGNGNGIAYRKEDFGQTLAIWGVGEGPYLQLPLLGPSTARDTTGLVVDFFLDPFNWWDINTGDDTADAWVFGRIAGEVVDTRSRNMQQLEDLEATSLDFYATIRSLYRQQRDNLIRNGEGGGAELSVPTIDFEIDDAADDAEETALLD